MELSGIQLSVKSSKYFEDRAILTAQYPASGIRSHPRRIERQLLHCGLDAPPLGLVAHQIHIGLELRAELLRFGVVALERDGSFAIERFRQCCRSVLLHRVWQQPGGAMCVNGMLSQVVDPARWMDGAAYTGQIQTLLPAGFAFIRNYAYTLAQREARRHYCHTHKQCVALEAVDGIEVALTQVQRRQIEFEDIAVGRVRAHEKQQNAQEIETDALKYLQIKASPAWGVSIHLRGECYMLAKLLI